MASSPPKLVRAVGLASLTALAVNGVIGSGIFVMPATVAALLGPASPVAYVIAGVAMILIVLSFAEAGSMFETAGGPYVYAREAFGRFVGFEVGWMFLLARMAGAAAIANAFAQYVGHSRTLAISLMFAVLAAVNYFGVRYGAWIVNVLTIGKLLPILLFIGAGLFALDTSRFTFLAMPELGPLRQASLVLLFALGGFEFASVPSEEAIDSKRNLPIALVTAILLGVTVYILAQVVCSGTLPGLATDPTPAASAARIFLGPAGGVLLTVGALLSTSGTNGSILLVGPRMLYALAQGGHLPAVFGRVHPRYRTPHVAVVVFAACTLVVALSGTFAQLAALNAIARLLYSITTCLSVPVLRRKIPPGERKFTLPGGMLIPALGVLASVALLTGVTRNQALIGGAAMLAGAVIYRLAGSGN